MDFGFLDFTTLDRRKHFCEEEVRINRRLCARIYRGVTPLSRCDGKLRFGDDGEIVDYAVTMEELDARHFLHTLLEAGALNRSHIDRVVDALVGFYRSDAARADLSRWGTVEALRVNTDENFDQTAVYAGRLVPRAAYEAIQAYTRRFYAERGDVLERRRAEGRIVDGHGDLRLEHIHAGPEGLCIYDAIEFSERLRAVDVASDIGFLAMDLDFNGRHDLARYVTDRIAHALNDPGLRDVIDFYTCYRAYVRAKVESMRSEEPEVPESERAASRDRARRYYRLALRYATLGARPVTVVVMGRIGAGKSTLAGGLGEALAVEVVSSDRIRKEDAGVPLFERSAPDVRQWLYAPGRTEAVYAALRDRAVRRAAEGKSTILDATYGRQDARQALRAALDAAGVPCLFIEVTASDAAIRARLARRSRETGVVSDARLDDFETLAARYEAPAAGECPRLVRVEARDDTEETLAQALMAMVKAA
ncbi:MAG: AAA family ATPase [Rhodothermales bacterium]